MEGMKKTDTQLPTSRQKPIKTEWDSRSVLFTYFQGDINSEVDEHFSRALSNIKRPQELNPSSQSQSEEVILKNDGDMPPNHWHFSSPWTKPLPEASLATPATTSRLSVCDPMAVDHYPLALSETPSAHPRELWHFPSLASPSTPEPGYAQVFPGGHLVPGPHQARKCDPFLSYLQQDRCLTCPQEPAVREDYNPVQIAGSTGLFFNLPPSSVHCKKLYVSPSPGPVSPSLANETLNYWGHPAGYPSHFPSSWRSKARLGTRYGNETSLKIAPDQTTISEAHSSAQSDRQPCI
ncbi:PREDICTED: transcription cofactor vestigial-like protein 1 isoform X2 [Chinchilla lanigera]|uniref:transcription cofactor vestigial-like protein 1 isoform X2 n=1 Tax=Chinchilla lanigera TaxID=34839 RepID=UPI00038F0532|nr:PREDICTED: transcription cofactor vestigial-like protein 1 isoform X2 [Chinchilla lanigera]